MSWPAKQCDENKKREQPKHDPNLSAGREMQFLLLYATFQMNPGSEQSRLASTVITWGVAVFFCILGRLI